jgi:XTP/dITP diphosphohydrolase
MGMRGCPTRKAKMVACIVAFSPDGERKVFTGEFNGTIAKAPRGTMGFGYDQLFIP